MKCSTWHVSAELVAPGGHGIAPGQVLVAREVLGESSRCAASPFMAGELRRRGVATVSGVLAFGAGDLLATTGPGWAIATAAADPATTRIADAVSAAWSAVAGPRTVLLAAPRAFCAGVERAVTIVERALAQAGGPVYVRKQIVHNVHVVADLRRRGAVFVDELDAVPDGATVVFSAHGVSPAVRAEARRRGLDVVDATCPLVSKVHAQARRHAARGDAIVLIGHDGHEEVEGTMGEAPDSIVLVESVEKVAEVDLPAGARVSYLTQTTLAVDETADVVSALRTRFPDLLAPESEDICYATTNRQHAAGVVAERADFVLVVGSPNSSNSTRLVGIAERHGARVHLIDDVSDIRPEWLAGAAVVGLTAGASAPPALVDEVVVALGGLGPVEVEVCATTVETIEFGLPAGLRATAPGRSM